MQQAKIHLYRDNTGRKFRNGAPGVMANTLCMSNHTKYVTTKHTHEVTCRACLRKIPQAQRASTVVDLHAKPGPGTTVPKATVEALADNIKQLLGCFARQRTIQAKMVRWCVWALNQTTNDAERILERERRNHPNPNKRIVRMHEPGQRVREDKAKALLYLEWLATQLENAGAPED